MNISQIRCLVDQQRLFVANVVSLPRAINEAITDWEKAARGRQTMTRYDLKKIISQIAKKIKEPLTDEMQEKLTNIVQKIITSRESISLTQGFHASCDLVFASENEALQHLADLVSKRVVVGGQKLSDEEAIRLFDEDPVKNFDVFKNRKIEGNLNLYDNDKITSLPEGLKVGGCLTLDSCTSLTSLPEGLEVDGDLSLCSCKSLMSLPEGLKVGEDLWLTCSDKLIEWLVKERRIEWLKKRVGGEIKGMHY